MLAIIGKGKSKPEILEGLILQDVLAGRGCGASIDNFADIQRTIDLGSIRESGSYEARMQSSFASPPDIVNKVKKWQVNSTGYFSPQSLLAVGWSWLALHLYSTPVLPRFADAISP
ncbi:MAG: hypothetical protein ABI947_15270 [Chloroflexota bacterium]